MIIYLQYEYVVTSLFVYILNSDKIHNIITQKGPFLEKKNTKNHTYLHKLSTQKYILLTIYSTKNQVILKKKKQIVNTDNYNHIRCSSLYIIILTNSSSLCILTYYYQIKYHNNTEM